MPVLIPAIVLALASLFFLFDITVDIMAGDEGVIHLVIETIIFISVSVLFFVEIRRVIRLRTELSQEKQRNARLSGELIAAIHERFHVWNLTASESDVAMMLVKGLSMREIADTRGVKEKTIRQQAASIYAKSGFSGRHELVAGFIEDLLTP